MNYEEKMDALAQRVAELKPDWAMVGMSARDPELGTLWRKVGGPTHHNGWRQDDLATRAIDGLFPTGNESSMRAEAAGPNWRDTATVGCLLSLVREAYKTPSMFVRCEHDGLWRVCWSDGEFSTAVLWVAGATTEAEALLNALEESPGWTIFKSVSP